MSSAYPISSPVEFTNTTAGDILNFNADGPTAGSNLNQISNFVATNPGDFLYRDSTGTSNVLERLAIGSAGEVLTVSGTQVAQVADIIAGADTADSMNNTYFLLDSPTTSYYVWYSTGAGADPALTVPLPADLLVDNQLRTAIPVVIGTGETAVNVAIATAAAINALGDFSVPVPGTPTFTITNADFGAVAIASNGSVPPSAAFTYSAASTPGVSAVPAWTAAAPGSASETFLTSGTVAAGTVAAGSTWLAVDSAVLTWDDTTVPNHDSGTMFTVASGLFTVPASPATPVYSISAVVTFEGNSTGNGGGGISGRRGIRQARIRNTVTNKTLAFAEAQAQGSNLNPTQLSMVVASAIIAANDTIRVEVRHDANAALSLSVNEDETPTVGPSNYFSAHRLA